MSTEHCEHCGREDFEAKVESVHHTSEGVVRYRRCPCGSRWVDTARFRPIAHSHPPGAN